MVSKTIHTWFIANALPKHTLDFRFFYYLHKTILVIYVCITACKYFSEM